MWETWEEEQILLFSLWGEGALQTVFVFSYYVLSVCKFTPHSVGAGSHNVLSSSVSSIPFSKTGSLSELEARHFG